MDRDGIAGGPVKRVEPFQGLMIDAGVWRDAHDYHRRHQQLHALLLHGTGIVRGLEVEPTPKPGRGLIIQPGVALDPEGRLIVVPQALTYQVSAASAGLVYLILDLSRYSRRPAAVAGRRRAAPFADAGKL